MSHIFLAFPVTARANYYGDRALAGLSRLGKVTLNELDRPLSASYHQGSAAAADPQTETLGFPRSIEVRRHVGTRVLFPALPHLRSIDTGVCEDSCHFHTARSTSHGLR